MQQWNEIESHFVCSELIKKNVSAAVTDNRISSDVSAI